MTLTKNTTSEIIKIPLLELFHTWLEERAKKNNTNLYTFDFQECLDFCLIDKNDFSSLLKHLKKAHKFNTTTIDILFTKYIQFSADLPYLQKTQ